MPTSSSAQDIRALTQRWFAEVWNAGREEAIDEMMAPDARMHGLTHNSRELNGPAAFREFYRPMRRAFPDIRVDVDDVLTEGDQVACRLTARATHSGDGLGVPPTGRPVTFTALAWARWRDGRMVEGWNEFDSASVMAQIGTGQPTDKAGSTVAVKPH